MMRLFGKKPKPEYPEAMIKEAAQTPNGHVYEIDAAIGNPSGEVPPFAIKGAHQVDGSGVLTGKFEENPHYDHTRTLEWVAEQVDPKEKQ